eukprot:TRINITY_DN496_c0_g1_i4.p1 TRINITY_DN496_c0_g1~~TRINITY_DN496_c0_g1_i4.p1  ORF type:complete len:100 (-),score=6.06 TRINITY_DN496_c0_g1_i4:274-573(-)
MCIRDRYQRRVREDWRVRLESKGHDRKLGSKAHFCGGLKYGNEVSFNRSCGSSRCCVLDRPGNGVPIGRRGIDCTGCEPALDLVVLNGCCQHSTGAGIS